jgi:hypothetical protein
VTAEGQLVLDEQPDMPPGRVEVIVRPLQDAGPAGHPMFDTLKRIWAEQEARGFTGGRSAEEAAADVRALRDEWDDHQQDLEQRQDRHRGAREEPRGEPER